MQKLPTILSAPCPVRMAGFVSNTYLLQREGWELVMEQEYTRNMIRLIMKHNVWKTYGVSSAIDFYYFDLDNRNSRLPDFNITYLASRLTIMEQFNLAAMSAIDATPEMHMPIGKDIEDFKLFKTVNHSKDIVVDPSDVAALMDHILKIQSPIQAEIRDRKRKEQMREGVRLELDNIKAPEIMHAQIISLAS